MSVSQTLTNAKQSAMNAAERILEAFSGAQDIIDAEQPDWVVLRRLREMANDRGIKTPRLDSMNENFTSRSAVGTAKKPASIFTLLADKLKSAAISEMKLGENFLTEVTRIAKARVENLFGRHYSGENASLLEKGRVDKVTKQKARRTVDEVQGETIAELNKGLVKRNLVRTYKANDPKTREFMELLRNNERVLRVFGKTSLKRMNLSDSALQDVFKEYSRGVSDMGHVVARMPAGSKMAVFNYAWISRQTTNPLLKAILAQIQHESNKEARQATVDKLKAIGQPVDERANDYCDALALSRFFIGSFPSLGMTGKKMDEKVKEVVDGEDAVDSAIVMLGSIFIERHRELYKKAHPDEARPASGAAATYVAPGQSGRTASNSKFVDSRQDVQFSSAPPERDQMFGMKGVGMANGNNRAGSRPNSPNKRNQF